MTSTTAGASRASGVRQAPAVGLALCLAASLALAACAASGGAGPSPSPSVPASTSASPAAPPSDSAARTATVSAAPSARVRLANSRDVPYERSSALLEPGVLDVYRPSAGAGLPVVVMLHGEPFAVDRSTLNGEAVAVATAGAVVFVADWGHLARPDAWVYPTLDEAWAANAQVACAIAFAAQSAPEYGGDPSRLIVFGHSGGGMMGATVVFAGSSPSPDCLADGGPATVTRLVAWDGEFLLGTANFDPGLADEPRLMDASTPWGVLAKRPALPVALLMSETYDADYERPLAVGPALEAFLKDRDRGGVIAASVAATGVLADGTLTLGEESVMLEAALRANGNPVTLATIPGSTHTRMGALGWPVLVEAILGSG